MKSLEDQLAAFMLTYCKGAEYADYRRACFRHWRERYGDETVRKVRAIVAAQAKR